MALRENKLIDFCRSTKLDYHPFMHDGANSADFRPSAMLGLLKVLAR